MPEKTIAMPDGELDELEVLVMCEDSVMYESSFLGQHGISLLVRARSGGFARSFLMDVGQNPKALLANFPLMGADLKEIDGIVVTHCHYDHTQGLAEVVRAIGKSDLPVIAHPSIFRLNFITAPYLRNVGVLRGDAAERLYEAGAELYLCADPLRLMPGLFTTGQVRRRTDFEEVGISSLATLESGRVMKDEMQDDVSLVARVRGKSPVVLTGCSHAGIVNILKQVSEMCAVNGFENVIGGLHLVEAPDDRIRKTCEALKGFAFNALTAGHCTGFRAQAALHAAFGTKFSPLQTGMRFRVQA